MRKKILSFILAASLALNGMPMMASASQIDPVSSSTETNEPEQTTVLISEWSWADEYEVIDTDSNTAFLPTIGSFDTVVSVLPAAILFDDGKEAAITEWKCDDFAEQAGTYTFTAALEEGYELEETAPALTLTVEMGQVEVQDTGDTEKPHTHCICGGSKPSANNHTCNDGQEWQPWGDSDSDSTTLPTTAGYYYLTTDVTLNSTWYPQSNIFLCLHGHVISRRDSKQIISLNSGRTLTITDCQKTEQKFTVDENGLWTLDEDAGTKTLKGGVITGGNYSNGGGISSSGTLHMYGGNIVGNTSTSDGGGIFVSAGTFYMYGGTITENKSECSGGGVYIKTGASFKMYDGTISDNTANLSGGGVSNAGTFTMTDGTISKNTANSGSGGGGGVYNSSTFIMNSGTISNNEASYDGGGVNTTGSSTFTMNGGTISGNTASNNGGGVYVYSDSKLELSGAPQITGNHKGEVGENLYISNTPNVTVNSLTNDASIGVTLKNTPSGSSGSINISNNTTDDYSLYFSSDNPSYHIEYDSDQNRIVLAYGSPEPEPIPSASFEATGADCGTLSNVSNNMQYRINDGTWTDITNITDNKINLTDLSACTISVIAKGSGSTIDSEVQTITITKAASPANLTAVDCEDGGINGKINGVTTNMEYCLSTDGWNSSQTVSQNNELTGLTPNTYWVRTKASGTILASENTEVTINYTPTITCASAQNGSATAKVNNNIVTEAAVGTTVTIEATPDPGYEIKEIKVYKTNAPSEIIDVNNNQFTMPENYVTINVTFRRVYNIWIGDVQINETNASNVFGDGKVSYDATTDTLTLNGYSYEGDGYLFDQNKYAGIYSNGIDLNIVLSGTNSVICNKDFSIYTENGSLNISGNGTVTAKGVTSAYNVAPTVADNLIVYAGNDEDTCTLQDKTLAATYTDNKYVRIKPLVSYTVTLECNGGHINSGNISSYIDGIGADLPVDVTRNGYRFEGWFENSDFSGQKVTSISSSDTGNKIYYSKWVKQYSTTVSITGKSGERYSNITSKLIPLGGGNAVAEQVLTADNPNADIQVFTYHATADAGLYNLVITATEISSSKTLTLTTLENLSTEDITESVTLSDYEKNSVVKDDSGQGILAGGVEDIANEYTVSDTSGSLKVELLISDGFDQQTGTADEAKISTLAQQNNADILKKLDIDLTLYQYNASGNEISQQNLGNDNDKLLDILIPVDTAGKTADGFQVYRVHNGTQHTLPYNGESFTVDLEGGFIQLKVRLFSSYAIAYSASPAPATCQVDVTANPAEGGTVSGGGTYNKNLLVTVTATANSGYRFVRWTKNGNEVSTNTNFVFTASENCSLVAVFEPYSLNEGGSNTDSGSSGSSSSGSSGGSSSHTTSASVQSIVSAETGDDTQTGIWLSLISISLAGIFTVLFFQKRRSDKEKNKE